MAMTKSGLRAQIRSRRPGSSIGLTEKLVEVVARARTVASFNPLASEPDVSAFNSWVLGSGRRLLLPEITGELLVWREPGEMVPGRFGVLSPTGALAELTGAELIVMPALAVDRDGVRLGQGGGYYDRALATLGAREHLPKLVAVIFDDEIIDRVPREAHDVPVDTAVSPSRILHFTHR